MSPRTVPDHAYRTLGVSRTDDFATIRRIWQKRVRALYPRVLHGDDIEEATRALAALNDAYDAMRWHRQAPDGSPKPQPRARPHPRPQAAPRASVPRPVVVQAAAPHAALDSFSDARRVFTGPQGRTLRHA